MSIEVRWERDGSDWLEITTRRVPDSEVLRCVECGVPMPGVSSNRLTCSAKCRVRKWRKERTEGRHE